MKSKNTFKTNWNELIKRQGNSLKKSLLIRITAAALFVLSGCQDQMASIKTNSFNYSAFNETIPKSVSAQLASNVTVNKDFNAEVSGDSNKDAEVIIFPEKITPQYKNTQIHNLEYNRETWKETYNGIGIPLLKISFW